MQPTPVEARGLTKRYGEHAVVEDLSFTVAAGRVTGFLGPNGAGKTTTLRMLLGLIEPTAGTPLVFGTSYRQLVDPTVMVGALLDASGFHPGRRVRHELAIRTAAAGLDDACIEPALAEVGLEAAADKRVGALSLGMRQRLGLAVALIGSPQLLVLDEPANGLDPAGMHWLRALLQRQAARGAAVLISSHVLAELALVADDVVVINHGRLVTQSPTRDLVAAGAQRVRVDSPQLAALMTLIEENGATVDRSDDALVATGLTAPAIGELAAAAGIPLHELRTEVRSLEEIFLQLTDDGEGIR